MWCLISLMSLMWKKTWKNHDKTMIDQWISDVFHGFFPPGPDPAGRSYGCAGTVRRTCSGQGIASDSLSLCWWDFTSFIRYYHIYIYTMWWSPSWNLYWNDKDTNWAWFTRVWWNWRWFIIGIYWVHHIVMHVHHCASDYPLCWICLLSLLASG